MLDIIWEITKHSVIISRERFFNGFALSSLIRKVSAREWLRLFLEFLLLFQLLLLQIKLLVEWWQHYIVNF